jgi:hypothetical protein
MTGHRVDDRLEALVYLRPRPDVAGECEWMWIERRDRLT